MLRLGIYKYVVDCVSGANLVDFTKAISTVPAITAFDFNQASRILVVEAASDPEDSIRLACQVVGAQFRVGVKWRSSSRGDRAWREILKKNPSCQD